MQSTCLLDKPYNINRREVRKEASQHRDLMLHRKIEANRKKYPSLYKIIDSRKFQSWWTICTGKPWDQRMEADADEMASKLNAMQLVYGAIPDG